MKSSFLLIVRHVTVMLAVMAGVLSALAAEPLRVFIRGGQSNRGQEVHAHPRFLGEWTQLLTGRGMKVEGAMELPTAEQLERTDVLVMYAQEGGDVPEEKRPGLEAFLKRGGGLVVLHTATVPLNKPGHSAYLKSVIGGSWVWNQTKWLEGPMSFYYTDQTHPITRGAANFDLNDEIYYDMDLDPSIRILGAAYTPNTRNARRNDPRGQPTGGKVTVYDIQPQMWTFERTLEGGKPYRAFVSIPGHQFRTFHLPHYRAVLLRGIAWAGKREALDAFAKPEELASLRYPEGGPSLPAKSKAQLDLHPEFEMSLVAAEPLINKPMNIDWDEKGRLWVAETPEYPDGRYANGPADLVQQWTEGRLNEETRRYERPAYDKISILTDSDGDGLMDRKQIFHEGLELVTSLVLHKDGVIVSQAPDVLFLRDTNGDGRADVVEKLYTGLGVQDTHAVLNNLRWGFDGWIYGTHGYSAGKVKSGDGSKEYGTIGSGVVRFKPDGSAFEQFSSKGGNTWGLQMAWDHEVFWTQPTSGDLLMHVVMSEAQVAGSKTPGLTSFKVVSKSIQTFPLIPYEQLPYVQIDLVGRFTAAAGTVIYGGGAWPTRWNQAYLTTEPTINIVHHQHVRPEGVSYAASRETGRESVEFIGGKDMWFRPIEVRTGPDGAVYVVDFYNQAVIHNDTRGPKHGPKNAAVRPDRDHYYGRIWRVHHKESRKLEAAKLEGVGGRELARALEHPNDHTRMNAVRLLVEKGLEDGGELARIVAGEKPAHAKVGALWALARLGRLGPSTVSQAARDGSAAVRRNALMAAAGSASGALVRSALKSESLRLAGESDRSVALQALLALAEFDLSAEEAVSLVRMYPGIADAHVRAAFMRAAHRSPAAFLDAAFASSDAGKLGPMVNALTSTLVGAKPEEAAKLAILVSKKGEDRNASKKTILDSLAASSSAPPAWTSELKDALRALLRSADLQVAAAALPVAVRWDEGNTLSKETRQVGGKLMDRLSASGASVESRVESARILLSTRKINEGILGRLGSVLSEGTGPLQMQLIEVLGGLQDAEAGSLLVSVLPKLGGEGQAAAVSQILKRAPWSLALVQALDSGAVRYEILGPANAYRLRQHPDNQVAERAAAVIARLRGPEMKEKDALIARFVKEVEKPGNTAKGKELFNVNCGVCHQFGGGGKYVGPPLDGIGAHGPSELLVHILDPNREVDLSFTAWSIETKDGESLQGVIARENNAMIALRDASGEREVPKTTVASRRNTGRSLMPEGFEALGEEGLRDLLAYMSAGENRYRFVDLLGAYTADSRRGMYRTVQSDVERLHLTKRGAVVAHGIPFRISEPGRHRQGYDVVVLKGGAGREMFSRTLPQKVEAKVGLPARQLHFLGGIAGWGYPAIAEKLPALKASVRYASGSTESFTLHNAVEFADYNKVVEVPGSKLVRGLTEGDQLRLHSLKLGRNEVVDSLTLESFNNDVAATLVAITADLSDQAVPGLEAVTRGAAAAPPEALKWEAGTRALLVGGGSSHDFHRFFNLADVQTLKEAGLSVNYTESAEVTAAELGKVEVVVLSVNSAGWDSPDVRRELFAFAGRGKGIVLLHAGVWLNYPRWPEYNRSIVGGASRGHDRLGEFGVKILNEAHPITRGVSKEFRLVDELYYFEPDPQGSPIEILAETTPSEKFKKPHPSVWIVKHDQARIAGIALGHDGRAHSHEDFKKLLINAVRWAAKR